MGEEKEYEAVCIVDAPCEKCRTLVKIKRLHPDAVMPRKATAGAAAYDVYLHKDVILQPGRQIIPLGLAIQLPPGYEAKIEPRSGYSAFGMEARLADTHYRVDADVIVGKIDSDYRGEIGVIVKSNTSRNYILDKGQRIAQLTVYRVETVNFEEASELSQTERGRGGFGHTGTR